MKPEDLIARTTEKIEESFPEGKFWRRSSGEKLFIFGVMALLVWLEHGEQERKAWLSARQQLIARRRAEFGWLRRTWLNLRHPIPPRHFVGVKLPEV